jgi:Short repeat of unknown function (DUF308)
MYRFDPQINVLNAAWALRPFGAPSPLIHRCLLKPSWLDTGQVSSTTCWLRFFFGVTGLLIVTRPVLSAEVATMLMAVFFLISGLFQFIGSIWVVLPGWGWQAADGIITVVLGILVLAQWPASGLWVIGLFIGIDLIFYGGAWIALALALRASASMRLRVHLPPALSWYSNSAS